MVERGSNRPNPGAADKAIHQREGSSTTRARDRPTCLPPVEVRGKSTRPAEPVTRALLACPAMDLPALRDVARRASLVGGDAVRAGRVPERADPKGLPGDWVTEVDLASEQAIAGFLRAETPSIPFLGEESGGEDSGLRWLVDPLDGTTNFVHGFAAVGVSIALVEDDDRPVAAAVHAPFLGDLWHAAEGLGAAWERPGTEPAPCRVSDRPPDHAIVGTGFPFRRKDLLPRYLEVMGAALETFEDLRRPGAASLDLAWTACGVFDGFFELALGAWDVAAGGLIVQEAGGVVTDWAGGPGYLAGDILAGPPDVHRALASIAASAPEGGEVGDER
jgi:myo-inositol-1(or 4)-monophosphatase